MRPIAEGAAARVQEALRRGQVEVPVKGVRMNGEAVTARLLELDQLRDLALRLAQTPRPGGESAPR